MKLKLLPKFALSLMSVGAILTIFISMFSYNNSKGYLEDMYAEHVTVGCNTIATMLSVESVKEIISENGEQSAAYAQTVELFDELKLDGNITYLSLVVPDEDSVTFYIDACVKEMGDDPANQIPYGSDILYTDAASDEADLKKYEIIWDLYAQNKGTSVPVVTDNSYGYNYTAVAPILDENGQAIAEIQYILDMGKVREHLKAFLKSVILISLVTVMVAMIAYMLFVYYSVEKPIRTLDDFTKEITQSSKFENQHIDIRTGDEIESLSHSYNYMFQELGIYIKNLTMVTAEKERIGAELNVATQIQADMLPCIFPAFPGRKEFDIYATMHPAKEVGGDFYDFFLVDDDHLAMVMADVSGKGVPAALFMVIAKTLIKNRTQMGGSPAEILADVNEQLCEGNEAGLFVTVWLAILEISTGKGIEANAGHEHPVIKRKNGSFELIKNKHSLAVAAMEGVRFSQNEFEMFPGDRLFVYTDGVPEATNAEYELFGTERMIDSLNMRSDLELKEILCGLKEDIDIFVGEAPQFDDVTMLCLDYFGEKETTMKELSVEAKVENLNTIISFIESQLELHDFPTRAIKQIDVAAEEIFVNIASYAYTDGTGKATVQVEIKENPLSALITFIDNGMEYNPLEKEDPDITLSAEDREIGGLGIYMVKKSMDSISHEYKEGKNILSIMKIVK